MKRLFGLVMLCSVMSVGCSAALEERISTDRLWDENATEPSLTEYPAGTSNQFGYSKRLAIQNPLGYPINANIRCISMYQPDFTAYVPARRLRYYLITSPDQYSQSCFLKSYTKATGKWMKYHVAR